MKLFALEPSRPLGERIAERAGLVLASHEERDFEDGEFKVRPLEDVQGLAVAVVHSLHGDADRSASDKLLRLAVLLGALKDAGAREAVAVTPYLAFARKDRRTKPRDPVTIRYVAAMLEAAGLDAIVALDVHDLAAFENAFRRPKWPLEAAPLFVRHLAPAAREHERVVVMSPDAGGVKRARRFQELLDEAVPAPVELGMMEKRRSEGEVSGDAFAGDVDGAFVVVFDDLIAGGTTMARTARACRERGARAVHAAATHGVFGADAAKNLATPDLDSVVVTDSILDARERCPDLGDRLTILGSAPLFAEVLTRW